MYRTFIDDRGRIWEVWDVAPSVVERREGTDRRRAARPTGDRRVRAGARIPVPTSFRHGWLAFQTVGERRRLAPPPRGWDTLPDAQLSRLLRRAVALPPMRRLID